MKFSKNNNIFSISSVYARCNGVERLELREELSSCAKDIQSPWMVGSDFNVCLNEEEKLDGLAFTQQEIDTIEDMIRIKDTQFEINPMAANRADLSKMEAELKKYLKIEEHYWKQKAGIR
ncbi:hypothetical protein H5410_043451 [Solanum commersonii]|uniref:Endonuclease/exonuclease/phosphatase n=1 Tax=Solanum commersonii TaxID=4109 RepID=A0A9J5XXM2_SOLCO|nr:hypothetical protein H5410_043451 [Solanum commersonii]